MNIEISIKIKLRAIMTLRVNFMVWIHFFFYICNLDFILCKTKSAQSSTWRMFII